MTKPILCRGCGRSDDKVRHHVASPSGRVDYCDACFARLTGLPVSEPVAFTDHYRMGTDPSEIATAAEAALEAEREIAQRSERML